MSVLSILALVFIIAATILNVVLYRAEKKGNVSAPLTTLILTVDIIAAFLVIAWMIVSA